MIIGQTSPKNARYCRHILRKNRPSKSHLMICFGLEHLWDLLGSSSQLIISQKTGENARYYGRVLGRKIDFLLKIYETCWDQNQRSKLHLIIGQKSGKMLHIIFAFWEKNRGILCICGTFWDQNHTWLSNKKADESKSHFIIGQKKWWEMLDIIVPYWEKNRLSGWDQNHTCLFVKKVEKLLWAVLSFWETFWNKITIDHRSRRKKNWLSKGGEGFLRILQHLLGSKLSMIIGQQNRKNAWYYRRVLKKKWWDTWLSV